MNQIPADPVNLSAIPVRNLIIIQLVKIFMIAIAKKNHIFLPGNIVKKQFFTPILSIEKTYSKIPGNYDHIPFLQKRRNAGIPHHLIAMGIASYIYHPYHPLPVLPYFVTLFSRSTRIPHERSSVFSKLSVFGLVLFFQTILILSNIFNCLL